MEHVHFVGIGGSGLSAIARIALERGMTVSGSDRQQSAMTDALRATGAHVFIGHQAENIKGATLLVRSSAIPETNVEVQAAINKNVPVMKRDEYLDRMLNDNRVIAVAGTHGKTTTTSMISWTLTSMGQDPSYIIGGISLNLEKNAYSGKGPSFVIEADEYDRMFLGLTPEIAVVTNVEHDHPDCYPTPEDFYQAFRDFVHRLKPWGFLLACIDDEGARRLMGDARAVRLQVRSYGMKHWINYDGPDYAARKLVPNDLGGYTFEAVRLSGERSPRIVPVVLQVPGRHNVSNALATLGVVDLLGLSLEDGAGALSQFRGVGRRFDVRGEVGGITVIDDYAHHPSEIRATLSAARARYRGRVIWAVWQPHTYSRSRTLLNEFAISFPDADHVIVTEVYAAREEPPQDGFSSQQIVPALRHPDAQLATGLEQAVKLLLAGLRQGDVVLVLSAGDADQISRNLLKSLGKPDTGLAETGSRSEKHV